MNYRYPKAFFNSVSLIIIWVTLLPSLDMGDIQMTDNLTVKGLESVFSTGSCEDRAAPIIECQDTILPILDGCDYTYTLTRSAIDTGECRSDSIRWLVTMDIYADGVVDYAVSTFAPKSYTSWTADTTLSKLFNLPKSTLWLHIPVTKNGEEFKQLNGQPVTIPEKIIGSNSHHKITFKTTDDTDNFSSCTENVQIIDKQPPVPNCVDTIMTAFVSGPFPGSFAEVFACDFNLGSYDNCTDQADLAFTFDKIDYVRDTLIRVGSVFIPVNRDVPHFFDDNGFVDFDGDGVTYPVPKQRTIGGYKSGYFQRWIPEQSCASKAFICPLYPPMTTTTISVWDDLFNMDYCSPHLIIRGSHNCCGFPMTRGGSGSIKSEAGLGVEDVEVSLKVDGFEAITSITDTMGDYAFPNIPANFGTTVTAQKDGDDANGVSTLDLVLIQRHLANIQAFDSPYKMIAADVNNSKSITDEDIIALRTLILSGDKDFPDNTSWRFIDASQELDIAKAFSYKEEVVDTAGPADIVADFIAVKIGDVNNTANTTRSLSDKILNLTYQDRRVNEGERVEVTFSSPNYQDVYGYQFSMNLNGLEFLEMKGEELEMQDGNIAQISKWFLTVSYSHETPETASKLFTIIFTASKTGYISNMIHLSDNFTMSEAYLGNDLSIASLALSVEGGYSYALHQNYPNPFADFTVIPFTMASPGIATLTIYDVSGSIIKESSFEFSEGPQSFYLENLVIDKVKVLFYRLQAGDFSCTKRMFLIR